MPLSLNSIDLRQAQNKQSHKHPPFKVTRLNDLPVDTKLVCGRGALDGDGWDRQAKANPAPHGPARVGPRRRLRSWKGLSPAPRKDRHDAAAAVRMPCSPSPWIDAAPGSSYPITRSFIICLIRPGRCAMAGPPAETGWAALATTKPLSSTTLLFCV